MTDMTYADAMEAVMRANGGHASLRLIYHEIWEYKDKSRIVGKTPDMTIQALAQRDPRFVRIGLGVYALKSFKDEGKLPLTPAAATAPQRADRRHAAIPGMLLEIGDNTPDVADTYTHDRGAIFNNMLLGSIATLSAMPAFTYPEVIDAVRYVDVAWFNGRRYPASVFEVEHSTNFRNALTKFCELQDFQTRFFCVAESDREEKYKKEIARAAFAAVAGRCEFRSYEQVEADYETRMRTLHI